MGVITKIQREDLGTAFNISIKALRLYVVEVLSKEYGENVWADEFRDCLYDDQAELWDS
ncbi:MAG: hypothetical protein U5Q03_04145 [Bacteroidota bacterium]|nr:hypothetical protein [Bacteroidota bacterium]